MDKHRVSEWVDPVEPLPQDSEAGTGDTEVEEQDGSGSEPADR